jgi:hypothetical protein
VIRNGRTPPYKRPHNNRLRKIEDSDPQNECLGLTKVKKKYKRESNSVYIRRVGVVDGFVQINTQLKSRLKVSLPYALISMRVSTDARFYDILKVCN